MLLSHIKKKLLEEDTYNSSIYITVTTLKYLKKGGRITATAAAIGSLLKKMEILQVSVGPAGEFLINFFTELPKKNYRPSAKWKNHSFL